MHAKTIYAWQHQWQINSTQAQFVYSKSKGSSLPIHPLQHAALGSWANFQPERYFNSLLQYNKLPMVVQKDDIVTEWIQYLNEFYIKKIDQNASCMRAYLVYFKIYWGYLKLWVRLLHCCIVLLLYECCITVFLVFYFYLMTCIVGLVDTKEASVHHKTVYNWFVQDFKDTCICSHKTDACDSCSADDKKYMVYNKKCNCSRYVP